MAGAVSTSAGYMNDYILSSEGAGQQHSRNHNQNYSRTPTPAFSLSNPFENQYCNPNYNANAPNVRILNSEQHRDAEIMQQHQPDNRNRNFADVVHNENPDASMPWKTNSYAEPYMEGRVWDNLYILDEEVDKKPVTTAKRKKSSDEPSDLDRPKPTRKNSKTTGQNKKRKLSSAKTKSSSEGESSGNEDKDDEADKRQRGRPRLDTKDETAADRRRTQIRLAQRAYRQRKETTIVSLKRRVTEVESAIDDMQKAFVELHDAAMSHQVVESVPQFGRVLRTVTEKILSMAKEAGKGALTLDDDEDVKPEDSSASNETRKNSTSKRRDSSQDESAINTPTSATSTSKIVDVPPKVMETPVETEWPTTKIEMGPELGSFTTCSASAQNAVIRKNNYSTYTFHHPFINRDFFPPGLFCSSIPQAMSEKISAPNMFTFPPNRETVFAQRLGLQCLQHGYILLHHPSIDQMDLMRAFAYSLVFSEKEEVAAHVAGMLKRKPEDPPDNYEFPIPHLGGNGLHYNVKRDETGRVIKVSPGNREVDYENKTPAALRLLLTKLGFANDAWKIIPIILEAEQKGFLDPNEVEAMLAERGLQMTPFKPTLTAQGESFEHSLVRPPPMPRSSYVVPDHPFSHSQTELLNGLSNSSMGDAEFAMGLSSVFNHPEAGAPYTTGSDSPTYGASYAGARAKTLHTDTLIKELVKRCVCLGNKPGWTRSDVELCIMLATT